LVSQIPASNALDPSYFITSKLSNSTTGELLTQLLVEYLIFHAVGGLCAASELASGVARPVANQAREQSEVAPFRPAVAPAAGFGCGGLVAGGPSKL